MIARSQFHQTIHYGSLLLLAASIPPYSNLMNVAMIAMIANWLFEGDFRRKIDAIRSQPLFLLFVAFYVVHVLSLIYSENISEGIMNLEKKIMLLAFPLVIASSFSTPGRTRRDYVLLAFVVSTFAISASCLVYAGYKFVAEGTSEYFFHESLMTLIPRVQPVYYALYVCFAVAIVLSFLIRYSLPVWLQVTAVMLIAYFFGFVILTGARTATLALLIILFAGGLYYSRKTRRLPAFFIVLVLLSSLGAWVIMKTPALRERIVTIAQSKWYFDPEENNANGLTLRLVKWQCSLRYISESPILGVGIGDTQDRLQECYEELNFWGRHYHYNSHNQFIQSCLGLGIIGLIVLLGCLIAPLRAAIRNKDYLYVLFITLLTLAFLTESVFERKQGIIFYSFWNSFLALQLYRNNE
jgi:O-antigen ligase